MVATGRWAGRSFAATCTQRDLRHAVLELDRRTVRLTGSRISPKHLRPRAFLAGCPRLLSNAITHRLNRRLPMLVGRSNGRYVLRLGPDRPRIELVAREQDGKPVGMRFSGPAGQGETTLR